MVTIPASAQPVNRWVTADLQVTVTRSSRLRAGMLSWPGLKSDYEYAEFALLYDGMYHVAGTGCGRFPFRTPRISRRLTPRLGLRFEVLVSNMPSSAASVMYHGDSDRLWHKLGIRLPLDLAPFGMPGCRQYVSTEIPAAFRSSQTGGARWGFVMPNSTNLPGASFCNQGVVLDRSANALGITVSNYGHGVVGR